MWSDSGVELVCDLKPVCGVLLVPFGRSEGVVFGVFLIIVAIGSLFWSTTSTLVDNGNLSSREVVENERVAKTSIKVSPVVDNLDIKKAKKQGKNVELKPVGIKDLRGISLWSTRNHPPTGGLYPLVELRYNPPH